MISASKAHLQQELAHIKEQQRAERNKLLRHCSSSPLLSVSKETNKENKKRNGGKEATKTTMNRGEYTM